MKDLLVSISEHLQNEMGNLAWVDFDHTQIDFTDNQSLVQFPCVLIGVNLTECESIMDEEQRCTASIIVRIVFDEKNLNETTTSQEAQLRAIEEYDIIEKTYQTLQGFETNGFGMLERLSQMKEFRSDGLFVYEMIFSTSYMDSSAYN